MFGALLCVWLSAPSAARAQIKVNPTGVSTNSMAATTVFLTFGGLRNQVPVEGIWCGEVLPAVAPDRDTRCDPRTAYGRLPLRSDLARLGPNNVLTDIMSIPASVTRRAYYAAFRGQSSTFFYVRRFASTVGGADEFVVVTCRLTGGGAGVPFSLTNVTVAFDSKLPVQFVQPGELPPPLSATIAFNGSGNLRGRWEVVMPGEALPSLDDLLTEGTLPPELRGQQRRYALLERFNIPLLPTGKTVLPGPDPSRLPHEADGTYFVLLRIESSDDGAGDSNLGAAGAGDAVLHNGAVAGFPMPMLRYVVGAASNGFDGDVDARSGDKTLLQLTPRANARWSRDSLLTTTWTLVWGAAFYRVEFQTVGGTVLLSALVKKGSTTHDVPPTVAEHAGTDEVRWRVTALDGVGAELRRTAWRRFRLTSPPAKP
jgi:hypothetical protein